MYNKQLETFLKVAKTGSFSKAASELYISPSAVIQQLNHLEADLQVSLFTRTRQGVFLTDAGEYLKREASAYIQMGQDIRSHLKVIASGTDSICVGTSMKHKIRLFYDLWVLFSGTGKDYNVRLVNTETGPEHVIEADLIECVYADLPWQKEWKFLKIFDVPVGLGIPRNHPLSGSKVIHCENLRGTTISTLRHGDIRQWEALQDKLETYEITLREVPEYDSTVIWECACQQSAIMAPLCWQDVLFDIVLLPCDLEKTVPYGFCYRDHPTRPVQEFLDFVEEVYHGEHWQGAVPVF
jgi:DNA-binding transcriptional LysR family regulator